MTRIVGWGQRPFLICLFACVQFVVVTAVAMLFYPGGTVVDPSTRGYLLLDNFFSDLGRTVAANGQTNRVSLPLFAAALTVAGLGLALFFVAAPQFFRARRSALVLSLVGSVFGVISGLSYVGVAFTPADRLLGAHVWFVMTAFRAFLAVVICYVAAILLGKEVPKGYAAVYALFAALLAAYIALLTSGPGLYSPQGMRVQATGQKIIVYAAVVCMLIQSLGAVRLRSGRGTPPEGPASGRPL